MPELENTGYPYQMEFDGRIYQVYQSILLADIAKIFPSMTSAATVDPDVECEGK